MFNDHRPGNELDETKASAAEDRFEDILRRVKSMGAEVSLDETMPLHNNDLIEIGERRTVEFKVGPMDFQITRDVKNFRNVGTGHNARLEQTSSPMIEIKLKRKPETSDQWVGVDLEDMF